MSQIPVSDACRQATPLRKDALVGLTLSLVSFLPVMVIISLAPAVPAIVSHFSEIPNAATFIPLLVTLPALVVVFTAPLAGWLIDRFGRRRPLLCAALFYAFVGSAPAYLDSFGAIVISRILVGLCEATILVSGQALIADYFAPDRRRFWLTVQGFASPVLAGLMIVLAGELSAWAWNGAFLSYAWVLPIWLAVLLVCPEPPKRSDGLTGQVASGPIPWKIMALVCGATLFGSAIFNIYVIQVGFAYSAIGINDSVLVSRFLAISWAGVWLGSYCFNALSKRWRAENVLAICLAIMGTGTAMIGMATDRWWMLAGGIVQQVSAGMLVATLIFWLSQVLPAEHRGRGFGVWNTAWFAGQFLSPLLVSAAHRITGGILASFMSLGGLTVLAALALTAYAAATKLKEHA